MTKQLYNCKTCLWSDLGNLKDTRIYCLYYMYIYDIKSGKGEKMEVTRIPPKWCPLRQLDKTTSDIRNAKGVKNG